MKFFLDRLLSYSGNPIAELKLRPNGNPLLVRGITTAIQRQSGRVPGISVWMHVCTVRPGAVQICNNDDEICSPESDVPDTVRVRYAMPSVAQSWDELKHMLEAEGGTATGVIC